MPALTFLSPWASDRPTTPAPIMMTGFWSTVMVACYGIAEVCRAAYAPYTSGYVDGVVP